MSLQPVLSATRVTLAGAVLMLALPQIGLCQVTSFKDISDDDIDALDEIVVYGQPTLRQLRKGIYKAEENFYELFNSLNSGRQFDIGCFYRRFVGSHIRRRVCEAYFVKGADAGWLVQGGVPVWAYVRHKDKQMRREMASLVTEHTELQVALIEFAHAKQTFNVAVQERCAATFGICRN